MSSYLSIITKNTSIDLYSSDFLFNLNLPTWQEDAILHHYTSPKFNLVTKTVTSVLYKSVLSKSIIVFSQLKNSRDLKHVKTIAMNKILNHLTTAAQLTGEIQPKYSEASEVSFCFRTSLPANLRISKELEDIGVSSNPTHLETPRDKGVDKSNTNTTSNKYSYLKQIPKQSTIRFNKLLKVLMVSVVLVVLLNLVINFTLYGTLQTSIKGINEGTAIMSVLARQRYSLALTVFYAKEIYLVDIGVSFVLTREELKAKLELLSQSFKEDLITIQEYDEKDNSIIKLSDVKSVWLEYHNDHFVEYSKNLLNLLDRTVTLISKYLEYTVVTKDNPYLIEMYRNGLGEVMQCFNNTVGEFEDRYDEMINEFVELYKVIMLISIFILALLQGLGLAYILYIMNKERIKIWKIIETIPKQVINSMLAKIRERLMDNYNEELGEVTSKNSWSSLLTYKHSYNQKKLYFLTFIFVVISLVSVTYIYIIVLPSTLYSIEEKLELNDWTGQQQTFLYQCALWTRECGYENGLLKEYSYYINPRMELNAAIAGLQYSHKKAYKGIHLSSGIKQIYLGSFNSTHQLDKGLHIRVVDIVSTYNIICEMYQVDLDAGKQYAIVNTVYRREIENECNLVIDEIDKASEEKINEILADLLMVILLLLSAMVVLIIVGLLPVIMKLKGVFENEAHFISFVPLDDSL